MNIKIAAMLLAGVVLAPAAFAQTSDVPPNAVGDTPRNGAEDRSLMGRAPADPLLSRDTSVSSAFRDSFVPPEGDAIIQMAPRGSNLAETQAIDRATVK
jgi:hypothetical protein